MRTENAAHTFEVDLGQAGPRAGEDKRSPRVRLRGHGAAECGILGWRTGDGGEGEREGRKKSADKVHFPAKIPSARLVTSACLATDRTPHSSRNDVRASGRAGERASAALTREGKRERDTHTHTERAHLPPAGRSLSFPPLTVAPMGSLELMDAGSIRAALRDCSRAQEEAKSALQREKVGEALVARVLKAAFDSGTLRSKVRRIGQSPRPGAALLGRRGRPCMRWDAARTLAERGRGRAGQGTPATTAAVTASCRLGVSRALRDAQRAFPA